MGDPRFLSKSKITKNDICNYMLSEIEDYDRPVHNHAIFHEQYDSDNDYRKFMDSRNDDDIDELDELDAMRQQDWDEQEEYEQKMHDIHEKYPDFDAEGAIFRHEDPEAAERGARLDDYLNWW
ncbi:hypothetical protein [Butyrivibrio sp. AC2005]|uniref:hypothetical protein n=1 Tax=Butyrivibrio sp. AC2005 TaxID=1280672 RepID=UPI00040D7B6D|nr:hypothetical protein [Butyrivibrio sp. AC2005]